MTYHDEIAQAFCADKIEPLDTRKAARPDTV